MDVYVCVSLFDLGWGKCEFREKERKGIVEGIGKGKWVKRLLKLFWVPLFIVHTFFLTFTQWIFITRVSFLHLGCIS